MLRQFTHFSCFGLLSALLTRPSFAAPTSGFDDPCVKVAGKAFADPTDALACLKSFPFDDTLRQNVMSVVSGVLDFYAFEIFYSEPPAPFQESTNDIRGQIQRILATQYQVSDFPTPSKAPSLMFPSETDYDFNRDLYDAVNQLNDGHTRTPCYRHLVLLSPFILLSVWLPYCYVTYNNVLPAPIVLLDNRVFIAPDLVKLVDNLGPGYTNFLAAKNFDWQRLAGAEVIQIGGQPVLDYIDMIAKTVTGTYLDHNVRVNSVVSSYRIAGSEWSQRFGDHASELFPKQTSLDFSLVPIGSTTPETVTVPFVAILVGNSFSDGPS
jgi:hypothetical protein